MREIHVEIDEATMAAYGWDDVPLDHGFHTYRQMERWTVSPAARVEILDRLLELNHRARASRGPGRARAEESCSDERQSVDRGPRRAGRASIEQELLGPRNGPEEEIDGTPAGGVRGRARSRRSRSIRRSPSSIRAAARR